MYNYCLKTESSIRLELLNYANQTSNKWRLRHLVSPIKVLDIPKEILIKDKIIVQLYNQFKEFFQNPVIIKWDPKMQYNWHIDGNRGCALNLLLEEVDFLTLFSKSTAGSKGVDHIYYYDQIEYTKDKFNLLNTKIEHTLITFNEPRYLLSIGFSNSFEEVKDFCISKNL